MWLFFIMMKSIILSDFTHLKNKNRVLILVKIYNTIMRKILVFAFLLLSFVTIAHPGHGDHGDSGFTITHYFTTPIHMGISFAIFGAVIYFIVKAFRKKSKNA